MVIHGLTRNPLEQNLMEYHRSRRTIMELTTMPQPLKIYIFYHFPSLLSIGVLGGMFDANMRFRNSIPLQVLRSFKF